MTDPAKKKLPLDMEPADVSALGAGLVVGGLILGFFVLLASTMGLNSGIYL